MTPVSRSSGEGPIGNRNPVIAPAFRRLPPPLIVIGMHRSGTSLVSGMLSLMGVYMDPALSRLTADSTACPPSDAVRRLGYGEADAFRKVNDSLLLCAGADWRHVEAFMEQRERRAFRRWCLLLMQHSALTALRRDYLAHAPAGLTTWGWKDPRNSVTLPYWLRLFPDARVLHVRRGARDVVESLIRRDACFAPSAQSEAAGVSTRLKRVLTDPAYATAAMRRRLGQLPSTGSIDKVDRAHYRRLTDLYVRECLRARTEAAHYLEVAYEDLVARPYALAARMAEFAGVCPAEMEIERAVSFIERPAVRSGVLLPVSGSHKLHGATPPRHTEREAVAVCTRAR